MTATATATPTATETVRWVWVRGATYPYRQELHQLGGVWDKTERAWRLPYVHRLAAAYLMRKDSGVTIDDKTPVPELPAPFGRYFIRLRLLHACVVLNGQERLAVVGAWYDVEMQEQAFPLYYCHPLKDGVREPDFFTVSEYALNKHFESQV